MIQDFWRNKYSSIEEEASSSEFEELLYVHSLIINASIVFFERHGMPHINVPVTTSSASSPMSPGSDSAPVEAIINGKKILLTDSAQFYLEYACRATKNGCYYFGHSFRDEEPDERHLSQFTHIEAELPCSLDSLKKFIIEYIKEISLKIYEQYPNKAQMNDEIKRRIDYLVNKKEFISITYAEACEYLKSVEGGVKLNKKTGKLLITANGEKALLEQYGNFLWLENWDRMNVPFYQAVNQSTGLAINADLLCGIGETIGAGQRHYNSDEVFKALDEQKIDKKNYLWYTELKRLSPMLTSGFGMGVERYLMWLMDIRDIRSVELFPRNRDQSGIF